MTYRLKAFTFGFCLAAIGTIGCSTRVAIQKLPANPEVRALIDEANEARDVQVAGQKLPAALEHARRLKDNAGIALARIYLADFYVHTQKYPEALESLHAVLSYVQTNRFQAVEAQTLGDIAFVEQELGNTDRALVSYNQAVTILNDLLSIATEEEARKLLEVRGLTLFRKATAHEKLAQFGDAVEYYRRAAQDAKALGDDDGVGVALWLAARIVDRELKNQEQAIGLYAEAVPRLLAANDHKSAAWASMRLGEMYIAAGKVGEAREILLTSVKLGESLNLSDVVFSANYALATDFDNRGEFDQALPHYEAVVELIRKGEYKDKDDEIYLYALKRAVFIYTILSKHDLAIEYARAAALVYRERSDIEREIETLAELAHLYRSLADFETATDYLIRILKIIRDKRSGSDDVGLVVAEAGVLATIGDTLSFGGITSAADIFPYFEDAKKLLTSHMGFDLLNEVGHAITPLDEEGLKAYEALKKRLLPLDANLRTIVRDVYSAWGRLSIKAGELDTAIRMLSIAIACSSQSDPDASILEIATMKVQEGLNSYFLAEALRQKKNFALARHFLFAAETVAAEFRSPLINFAYAGLARTYADQGDFKNAVSYYKKGFQILESVQYQQITEQKKIELLEGALSEYRGLVVTLLDLFNQTHEESYLREAFEYNEKLKARTFLEILGNSKVARLGTNVGALTARQEKLRRQIGFTNERLKNRNLDLKEAKNLLIQLQTLHQEWQSLQREIAKQDSRYDQIVFPKPATISEVQAALSNDAVLLEYSTSLDGSKLWAITREEVQVYNLPGEKSFPALDAYLKSLREPLMDRKEMSEHISMGNHLYQVLVEPAQQVIRAKKKLIIVPDGPLYYLPFEALIVSGPINTGTDGKSLADIPYLIAQAEVSYVPSASILVAQTKAQRTEQKQAQLPLVAFGDPVYRGNAASVSSTVPAPLTNIALRGLNFNRLKFAEDEVLRIGRIWGVAPTSEHINLRERATVERLRDLDLTRYRIVHFATHAVLGDKMGMLSQPGLVLSQTGSDEKSRGLLQFSDILELKLNAELVVLSACETGLGNLHQGEGIVGLTRAFFYAGASSAVVSLWKVEDQSTSLLMEKFYQWLKKGANKAEALRHAKLEILNSKIELKALGDVQSLASPFYWAPFILIGDPAPLRN